MKISNTTLISPNSKLHSNNLNTKRNSKASIFIVNGNDSNANLCFKRLVFINDIIVKNNAKELTPNKIQDLNSKSNTVSDCSRGEFARKT